MLKFITLLNSYSHCAIIMPKKKKKELNYKKLIKTMIYIIFFMFIIEKR